MKAVSLKEIRDELKNSSREELIDICSRMIRFKKENKELLSYLLFKSYDEESYVEEVKEEMDEMFEEINTSSTYYMKKTVRKVLRHVKKHIRYSNEKESEIQLLIYYCTKFKELQPSLMRSTAMRNLYYRQISAIRKALKTLHEDLQLDYNEAIESLT